MTSNLEDPLSFHHQEVSPRSSRKRKCVSYDEEEGDGGKKPVYYAKKRNMGFDRRSSFDVGSPVPEFFPPNPLGTRQLSDHVKEMCNCQCDVCGKIFVHHRMLKHIERTHKLPAKDKFTYLRITHYRCKLCSSEMLFSLYTIGQHARSRHQMTLQQYRDTVPAAFQGDFNIDQQLEDNNMHESGEKEITDNLVDMCQVKCFVCHQKMFLNSLKRHLQKEHEDYDLEYPYQIEFLKKTYYKCKLCDALMLFHFDAINKHLSTAHNSTMHAYKNQCSAFTGDKEYKAVIKQADKEKARLIKLARQEAIAAVNSTQTVSATPKPPKVSVPKPRNRPKFNMTPDDVTRWSITLNSTTRYYTNNLEELCVRRCRVCNDMMLADSIKSHIYQHHRGIQENTGNMDYVRLTYHKCKVCGKDLKFTVNSITKHTKRSHNVNFKEYSQQYSAFDNVPCNFNLPADTTAMSPAHKKAKKNKSKSKLPVFGELNNINMNSPPQQQTPPPVTLNSNIPKENGYNLGYGYNVPIDQHQQVVGNGVFPVSVLSSPYHNVYDQQLGQHRPNSGTVVNHQAYHQQQQASPDQQPYGQQQFILPGGQDHIGGVVHQQIPVHPPQQQSFHLRPQLIQGQTFVQQQIFTSQQAQIQYAQQTNEYPGQQLVIKQEPQSVVESGNQAVPTPQGFSNNIHHHHNQYENQQPLLPPPVVAVKSKPKVVDSPPPNGYSPHQQPQFNNHFVVANHSNTGGFNSPQHYSQQQGMTNSQVVVKSEPESYLQEYPNHVVVPDTNIKTEAPDSPRASVFPPQQNDPLSIAIKSEANEDVLSTLSPLAGLDDDNWFDGNTFHCLQCGFISKSLDHFNSHIQDYHKLDWVSSSVSRTSLMYRCQLCQQEVYHEKSSIRSHLLAFHNLDIHHYATIYEQPNVTY